MSRPLGPPPVRLQKPEIEARFAPGRDTALARVRGNGLKAFDIRDGDHVLLAHRDHVEHGDLAAVLDEEGRADLWKVYPERDRLRLSMGHPSLERSSAPGARVQGVVVAVIRRFDGPSPADASHVQGRDGSS